MNIVEPTDIVTLTGAPVSILGLAGNPNTSADCVPVAFEAGINYYFFYNQTVTNLLNGLKPLMAQKRDRVVVATGSESRDISRLRQYLDSVRHQLNIDAIDVFFAEYISPADDMMRMQAVLDELHTWKEKKLIRYVGVTTHNRPLALELIETRRCEVLMHRYNMAHRKAEEKVLPAAIKAGIPVIAFTCTRWGSLLNGHPSWQKNIPTAGDCYRYALHHPAVRLALTAPKTLAQLKENLSVLQTPELSPEEKDCWQEYGTLIYGDGQDSFETSWQ